PYSWCQARAGLPPRLFSVSQVGQPLRALVSIEVEYQLNRLSFGFCKVCRVAGGQVLWKHAIQSLETAVQRRDNRTVHPSFDALVKQLPLIPDQRPRLRVVKQLVQLHVTDAIKAPHDVCRYVEHVGHLRDLPSKPMYVQTHTTTIWFGVPAKLPVFTANNRPTQIEMRARATSSPT